MTVDPQLFLRLGIALGLGLLVGLQRELVKSELAGIRTFALITLLGGVTALFDGWVVAVGLAAVAGTLAVGNLARARQGANDHGVTTEVAALIMFLVGAAAVRGFEAPAMAVGATVAVVLHGKARLHGLVGRLDEHDLRAILQLVVIALVVLPVLPNRAFGPYDVLNPHEIWRMVVLIVGIGLGGYIAFELLGARAGAVTSGVLGGLISSTATTLSHARHARAAPTAAPVAAVVVLLASSVVYLRLLVEVGVVAPAFFPTAAPRIGAMLAVLTLVSLVALRRVEHDDHHRSEHANPAELRTALVFAALYAGILLLVAWVKDRFGGGALYAVAVASGLTDMDAITLSTSRLVVGERLDADTGWRLILVASLSNLAFKGAVAAAIGGRALARPVVLAFAVALAAGVLVLAFG